MHCKKDAFYVFILLTSLRRNNQSQKLEFQNVLLCTKKINDYEDRKEADFNTFQLKRIQKKLSLLRRKVSKEIKNSMDNLKVVCLLYK